MTHPYCPGINPGIPVLIARGIGRAVIKTCNKRSWVGKLARDVHDMTPEHQRRVTIATECFLTFESQNSDIFKTNKTGSFELETCIHLFEGRIFEMKFFFRVLNDQSQPYIIKHCVTLCASYVGTRNLNDVNTLGTKLVTLDRLCT